MGLLKRHPFESMRKFTFKKEERLSGEKKIQELFEKGSSFYSYPFKVIYLLNSDQSCPHQVLISVPKRNFKKAVDRNTVKRRFRETYRLSKHQLSQEKKWLIAYIYTAKEIIDSKILHDKLPLTFGRIK